MRYFLPIRKRRLLALMVYFIWPFANAQADILSGLVNYYPLDESSGTIAHDVVGGNNATLQNFPVGQQAWVPGKFGNALNFTDSTNYVRTIGPISSDQYTIDFWLKLNGPGGINSRLVGPADGLYAWVILNTEFNRGVGFYYNYGASLLQDPNPPNIGVWENYAVTIDLVAAEASVYRNGVLVAAGEFHDSIPQQFWSFGHDQDPNNPLNGLDGQLDEIRIYDRALSSEEIRMFVPETGSVVLAGIGFLTLALWYGRRAKHSRTT